MSATATATAPCMDFGLSADEAGLVEIASRLFADQSSDERLVEVERSGASHDERLWAAVAQSGILEAVLPEAAGGAGLGITGLALVLREQGRRLGRIPLATTGVAALAIAALGGPAGALAGILDGTVRVAALLPETRSAIAATRRGSEIVLDGAVELGYLAPSATHHLVFFRSEGKTNVAMVPADRDGVDRDDWVGISGQRHAAVRFSDVRVAEDELIGPTGDAATWIRSRLLVAAAALQAGACQEAVRRTAAYVSEREQFGRPLSTNQGVAMRAADASIDAEAMELTMLDAAFHLDEGRNDARVAQGPLIAAWWAREAGVRVVHATQHLHGGMGADLDNPIHRFFTWVRELDVLWVAAEEIRQELGRVVADGSVS
ncbi:acyl-CoA/acyl-ACP dehydrogenase [Microbacterium resistens]|uniref:Acyl-CoA/acyl-ACP dehydrogenase n=1 Tax=Microbacterium resistens TaxID=156977 RepID=A0ABY3RP08_9MICO|nr:acyl-CoA dehydrogenase family protein [Microbacterium resistens]UGS25407.1 acyl-CoA/acyl-ACP dehydrogenase [Microbacterium resistens]